MNHNNQENPTPAFVARQPKPYRGKKENQRNPNAIHEPQTRVQKPQQKRQPPLSLNKPTHKAQNETANPQPKSSNPAEGWVFDHRNSSKRDEEQANLHSLNPSGDRDHET
ncbi:hypothetical protein WA026_023734 [Henosepilachna vigintioctopunctata]|uniref:Uncharacterized protein n=1 Tax=Henosepilachna vigintioctopunctata TaxID=420089 RepID=A0AAW1UDP7_9CUCU